MVEPDSVIAILPVHNRVEELRTCLQALLKLHGPGLRLVVVDDGSTEDTHGVVKELEQRFTKGNDLLEYIRYDRNYGAEKAMNLALTQLYKEEDYILKIDSDTEILDPFALKKMVDFLKGRPEIGILGPKMIVPGSKEQGGAVSWIKLLGTLRNIDKGEPSEVDLVNGGFVIIRKELYRRLKTIWSNILVRGWNELDLSERARAVGYKTYHYPHATILHWLRTTASKGEEEHYYDLRNLLLLNWKYGSSLSKIMNFVVLLLPRLGYWFVFRTHFDPSPLAAALRDFVLLRKDYSNEFHPSRSGVAVV